MIGRALFAAAAATQPASETHSASAPGGQAKPRGRIRAWLDKLADAFAPEDDRPDYAAYTYPYALF